MTTEPTPLHVVLAIDEMEQRADLFYELFEGREDVAFTDNPHPHQQKLDEGEMDQSVFDHLHVAGSSIGIYPLEGGNRCRWICSDFDTSEAEKLAWRYAEAWEYYGIQAWVETSRSKGYHVWVFADDWMSGTIARRAGLWVHELAGVEAIELNPKQELLEDGGYGNCVRLPYPHEPGRLRQAVLKYQPDGPANESQFYDVDEWIDKAHSMRTPVRELQRLAAMWKPKPPPPMTGREYTGDRTGGRGESNNHIVQIFRGEEDVKKGERDTVFFTLANHIRGLGMDIDEAMTVVREVWETQTEDKESFPLHVAVEKIRRVYGVNR